jgi:hypothetical protein
MTDDDDYRAERTMARAVRWNDGHRTANNSSSLNLLSLTTLKAIQGRCTTVRAEDFIISKRPRLGSITKHRKIEFTDYELDLAAHSDEVGRRFRVKPAARTD